MRGTQKRARTQLRRRSQALLERAYLRFGPYDAPSFRRYYAGHRAIVRHAILISGMPRQELWPWETKAGGSALAHGLGVATIPVLQGPSLVELLDWTVLPESFAIKSHTGTANAGVYVLQRRGSRFTDVLRGETLAETDVVKDLRAKHVAGLADADRVVAEMGLINEGRVVPDFKFFCFQGRIGLIEQIVRGPGSKKFRFYDENWQDLGQVNRRPVSPDLAPPSRPEDLLRVAAKLSCNLKLPFVRVDLYEHNDQVYFGELTQTPGGDHRYVPLLDAHMGQMWEESVARLLIEPEA